jgi:ABC-2 type transport system permease protein
MTIFVDGFTAIIRQSIMSFKALFSWIDPKEYILLRIINPLLQLTFFCLFAKYVFNTSDITPWVIGNSFLLCTTNVFFGMGYILQDERFFGTLKIIMVAPMSKFLIFVGRGLIYAANSLFTVVIGLVFGSLVFGVSFKNINLLMFFLIILIAMFASSGLGLLISSFGLITRDINLILNTGSVMLLALTGANFPISELPVFLQKISYCIPITRSIEAGKIMLKHGDMSVVQNLIFQEFLVGVIYTVLGYLMLRVMDYMSRTKATLDIY